jgi:hypothetical protein
MFSEQYLMLGEGEILDVDLPGRCIGFNINSRKTSCVVSFRGKGAPNIVISCFYDYLDGGFRKAFVPIPHGMQLDRLSISDAGPTPDMRAQSNPEPLPGVPTILALSRLVFWSGSSNDDWRKNLRSEDQSLAFTSAIRIQLQDHTSLIPAVGLVAILRKAMSARKGNEMLALLTHHDTVMVYDIRIDECCHVDPKTLAGSRAFFPVRVRITSTSAVLFVVLGGFELNLIVRQSDKHLGVDALLGQSSIPSQFSVSCPSANRFAFQYDSLYLSATSNGELVCDRGRQLEWETFSLTVLSAEEQKLSMTAAA